MLFVGDHLVEDHHDIEVVDGSGPRLAADRVPGDLTGLSRLHELVARHLPAGATDRETGFLAADAVVIVTDAGPGPWAHALAASGYEVRVVDPGTVGRGAELVRFDRGAHPAVTADPARSPGELVLARTYQSRIWDRVRHTRQLRDTLGEYFPAALDAFAAAGIDLDDAAVRELLDRAPDPERAARLSRSKIAAALRRAGHPDPEERAGRIQAVLRPAVPALPVEVENAHVAVLTSQLRNIAATGEGTDELGGFVARCFGLPGS
jgi:hypothetical protein